jgi:hypothetical protein
MFFFCDCLFCFSRYPLTALLLLLSVGSFFLPLDLGSLCLTSILPHLLFLVNTFLQLFFFFCWLFLSFFLLLSFSSVGLCLFFFLTPSPCSCPLLLLPLALVLGYSSPSWLVGINRTNVRFLPTPKD